MKREAIEYFGSVSLTVFLDNEGPGSQVGSATGNQ